MIPSSSPLRTSPVYPAPQATPTTLPSSESSFSSPPLSSPTPSYHYFQGKVIKQEQTPTRPTAARLARGTGSFDSSRYGYGGNGTGSAASSFAARASQARAAGLTWGSSSYGGGASSMRTTGFSLRPPNFSSAVDTSGSASASASTSAASSRPPVRRASSGASLPSLPNLSLLDSAEKDSTSLQGAMWSQRFRKRVEDKTKRREESAKRRRALREREKERGGGGSVEEDEDDASSDGEDEQIFARMMAQDERRRRHAAMVSYEREVGGSDPAIWEADIREAEERAARRDTSSGSTGGERSSSQTVRPGESAGGAAWDEADLEQLALLEQMQQEEEEEAMHYARGAEASKQDMPDLDGITWDDFAEDDALTDESPPQGLASRQSDSGDDVDMF